MTTTQGNPIIVESTIIIRKDINTVFGYIADLRLDKNWRKEINETLLTGTALGLNSIVTESSFLSKKVPAHKVQLQCIAYTPNTAVVYESLPAEPFYLKNSRQVTTTAPGTTTLTYHITFDPAIVKFGLGFKLPSFLVKYYTLKTMKTYLTKLQSILENQQ